MVRLITIGLKPLRPPRYYLPISGHLDSFLDLILWITQFFFSKSAFFFPFQLNTRFFSQLHHIIVKWSLAESRWTQKFFDFRKSFFSLPSLNLRTLPKLAFCFKLFSTQEIQGTWWHPPGHSLCSAHLRPVWWQIVSHNQPSVMWSALLSLEGGVGVLRPLQHVP